MTEWGGKLPDITINKLQSKLAETEDDGKAIKRLVAAIAYKQGEFAGRYRGNVRIFEE